MFGFWDCCDEEEELVDLEEPNTFSLPSPLPQWPKGRNFSCGQISLGEIQVILITKLDKIWSCKKTTKQVTFYKPTQIPDGYSCLGHSCEYGGRAYALVAKDISKNKNDFPPLQKPLSYSLVWTQNSHGYIWLPIPPTGYKPMGFIATIEPDQPDLDQVRCVRSDLTEACQVSDVLFDMNSLSLRDRFYVWSIRPCRRGMLKLCILYCDLPIE